MSGIVMKFEITPGVCQSVLEAVTARKKQDMPRPRNALQLVGGGIYGGRGGGAGLRRRARRDGRVRGVEGVVPRRVRARHVVGGLRERVEVEGLPRRRAGLAVAPRRGVAGAVVV